MWGSAYQPLLPFPFETQLNMRLLSGDDEGASIDWVRVPTGVEASLNVARHLAESSESLVSLDIAFRPVVVRF